MRRLLRCGAVGWLVALGCAGGGAVRAEDTSPQGLLAGRGLTRAGKYFVVASETPFLERWKAVRPEYEELVGQYKRIAAVEEERALMNGLDNDRIVVLQRIAEIDNELRAMPVRGNSLIRQRRLELEAARKDFDNRRAALRAEIDLRVKQIPPEPKVRGLYQEFDRLRQRFLNRTSDVRPLLDRAVREYNGLAKDPAVKNALNALRLSTKSQLELGPSPEFRAAQKELSDAQRNAQPPARKGQGTPRKGQLKKGMAAQKSSV